ncbi:MAG: hypothetical protein NT154_38865, partial [Verrucomicrobia bacterium]|nr:hypothetical protein [Verrucomicrobiota bacterium]
GGALRKRQSTAALSKTLARTPRLVRVQARKARPNIRASSYTNYRAGHFLMPTIEVHKLRT